MVKVECRIGVFDHLNIDLSQVNILLIPIAVVFNLGPLVAGTGPTFGFKGTV